MQHYLTLVQKIFFFLSSQTKLTSDAAATTSLREKPVVLVAQRLVVAFPRLNVVVHEEKE